MGLETELKFKVPDLAPVRVMLQAMGADFQGGGMEENLVFDTPGRDLFRQGVLLRLRRWGSAVLTLKQKPSEEHLVQGVKVWEETETEVADFQAMAGILQGLGYGVAFQYEKIRGVYHMDGTHVCLDLLPFGEFVEIEGNREDILAMAGRLALGPAGSSTASYHRLNREWRKAEGMAADENFVFTDREQALALARQLYPDS